MSSKTSQAYRQIKVLIEAGHLGAGQRVTEARVAKLVGLSRGPVRESLLRLEAEGLLHHKGSRRSRVVAYTEDQNPSEMLQRYELREQIESGAVRLASKNMTGWQIDRLRQLAQQVRRRRAVARPQYPPRGGPRLPSFPAGQLRQSVVLGGLAGAAIGAHAAASPELEDMILDVADAFEGGSERGTLVQVVEAIAAHDPDRAEMLMKRRIRSITEALRKTVWEMDGNGSKKSNGNGGS